MPPDNHNKISAHNFLAEVKQENCKWDFHPSKWKCHCNNNATQGKCENFLQLFCAQAKNNLYNCRKTKEKKNVSLLFYRLSFFDAIIVAVSMTVGVCFWQCSKWGKPNRMQKWKIIEILSAIECQMGLPAAILSGNGRKGVSQRERERERKGSSCQANWSV